MIYSYCRVSTCQQDYESQKVGILDYANRNNLTIDKEYIDNGVSGIVPANKRNLGRLLRKLRKGDLIIVSELSRLGRSCADVIHTCNEISQKGASCYMVKQGMCIDQSPVGKLMIAIFGAFSEMERDLIVQRTKEGLQHARANGVQLGRPVGAKTAHHKLEPYIDRIARWRIHGWSKTKIAKRCHVVDKTLRKYMAIYNIQ